MRTFQNDDDQSRVGRQPIASVTLPQRTLDVIQTHANSFLDLYAEGGHLGSHATTESLQAWMRAVASDAIVHFIEDMGLDARR